MRYSQLALLLLAGAVLATTAACDSNPPQDTPPGRSPVATTSVEPSPSPSATATPGPVGPFFVYTRETGVTLQASRGWPAREAVVFDLGTRREVTAFEYSGVGRYPVAVELAGSTLIIATEVAITQTTLDGTPLRVLRPSTPAVHYGEVAVSPDQHTLAFIEYRGGPESPEILRETFVVFLDLATGKELGAVSERDPQLTGIRSQPWKLAWRDDGRGVVVHGATHTERPGDTLTIFLDGRAILHRGADIGFANPSPTGRAIAVESGRRFGCMFIAGSRISITDLDTGRELALVEDSAAALTPWEWSPDSQEFLYQARTAGPEDDCDWTMSPGTLWSLKLDGSPPQLAGDLDAIHRRWYGDRIPAMECTPPTTRPQPLRSRLMDTRLACDRPDAPGRLFVGGIEVGMVTDVEIVGFLAAITPGN